MFTMHCLQLPSYHGQVVYCRFLPETKASRDQCHYFPFSIGPRNCVGMRLALMELKMSMVHILQKLKFVVCEETEVSCLHFASFATYFAEITIC